MTIPWCVLNINTQFQQIHICVSLSNLDSVSSFLFLSNNSPALTEWTPIASVWNVILCQLSDNHSKWITWNRHELHCLLLLAFVQSLGFNFYSGQLGAFHIISQLFSILFSPIPLLIYWKWYSFSYFIATCLIPNSEFIVLSCCYMLNGCW